MRPTTLLILSLFCAWTLAARPTAAADLALVLLNDASNSMDAEEYAMVKAGYRSAFADPEVIAALIGNRGGVAVAYVEFSAKREIVLVKGWDVLSDAASARAFGEAVAAAPRTSAGGTELGPSLKEATSLLLNSDYTTARQIIDIASDHPYDQGRVAFARDAAVEAGITINALPIINGRPTGTIDGRMTYKTTWGLGGIVEFYRRDVIGGPGSFVIPARSFNTFGEALKRKLLLEFTVFNREAAREVPDPLRTVALTE